VKIYVAEQKFTIKSSSEI